ncbi:MAG: two-component regulator propeller domain-containing protein [Chloroflexota bacterium]
MKGKPFNIVYLLIILALFASPLQAHAQQAPPRFGHLSIEQGLSQVTVYSIFQDRQGLMWFGTEDGLNRYDGYTFRVYKRDPEDPHSLSANTVRAIYEDSSGVLWVGTDGGGLNRFDRATQQFSHYRHDPNDPYSLSYDTVTAIHENASGKLWIGTDGGLNSFDPATGKFTRYLHDPNDPHSLSADSITAIAEDASAGLWISTWGGGLDHFEVASGEFSHYRNDPANANSLASDDVTWVLASERDGTLWIATMNGLDAFNLHTGEFTHYRNVPGDPYSLRINEVTKLLEDSSGTLWVGTTNGLSEFDRQEKRFVHYRNNPHDLNSINPSEVYSLYEDRSGVLWVGTDVGGLNKLDPKTRRFQHYRHDPDNPASLDSNTVWSIYADPAGTLWVGTAGGGLNQLDRESGQFIHYQPDPANPGSLSSPSALAVYRDSIGAIWVGTWDEGLNRLDPGEGVGGQFTHYRHDPNDPNSLAGNIVWAISEDSYGALWFGSFDAGLNRFDRETQQFERFQHDPNDPGSLSPGVVLTIYEDRARTLWVGTTQGLNRFERQSATFRHYQNNPANLDSLASNAVAAIFEDSSGRLWLGTDDGLDLFDRAAETFTHYTEKDGLANDAVACILEDEQGNLWISSNKGLSRFDPSSEVFKNYDVRDGLQSNEFNRGACFKGRDGTLYFGGVNGFSAFQPAQIVDNPHLPPVVITELRILNKPVGIGGDSPLQKAIEGYTQADGLTFSYWDYVFSFEFAALDYSIPEKNRYAYMLEGFDPEWVYVDSTRRFATYANLPAGDYTLRVKGSNNDGVWNEEGARLYIHVTPPPWLTWWAYTIYALLAAGVVAGVWRYRSNALQRKHLEQTMWAVQGERDRIAALLEARRQLVATLSHDLRTPVAVVRGHLEAALMDEERWQPPPRRTLEIVLQELDRLRALLDDLFTLSRLEVNQLALSLAPLDAGALALRAVTAMQDPAWRQGRVQVVGSTNEETNKRMGASNGQVDEEIITTGTRLWVMADEGRLMQVLMNLLHNAVRHTPPGGVVVVSVDRQEEAVNIHVRDTGEGIHPDDLPRIWERFYRGQSGGAPAVGGAGLGLALVKELVGAMKGSVGVESALGEGSCFTITLPLARMDAPSS